MTYSLREAAAATGLVKSTILRAIKAGKLSAVRDQHGGWQIEPSALHAIYPAGARKATDGAQRQAMAKILAALEQANLRRSEAERRLADARTALKQALADKDAWREVAQRLARKIGRGPT